MTTQRLSLNKDMYHLLRVDNKTYKRLMSKYGNTENLMDQTEEFETFAYNGYLRYLETGDGTHINRVLSAALVLKRFREFRAILKSLVAHPWEKKRTSMLDLSEKADKALLKALRQDGPDMYVEESQKEADKQKEAREFDMNKYALIVFKQLQKNNIEPQQFFTAVLSNLS